MLDPHWRERKDHRDYKRSAGGSTPPHKHPTASPGTSNWHPKTPRACTQFASSALRSRVRGKNPWQLQGPRASGGRDQEEYAIAASGH